MRPSVPPRSSMTSRLCHRRRSLFCTASGIWRVNASSSAGLAANEKLTNVFATDVTSPRRRSNHWATIVRDDRVSRPCPVKRRQKITAGSSAADHVGEIGAHQHVDELAHGLAGRLGGGGGRRVSVVRPARAGEQGRGFAVVADEVRQLAGRTSAATEEIVSVVEKNQTLADEAVKDMSTSREQAAHGLALASQAGTVIIEIQEGAKQVVNAVQRFANELS